MLSWCFIAVPPEAVLSLETRECVNVWETGRAHAFIYAVRVVDRSFFCRMDCRHVRDGCMEDAASAGKRVRAFRSIVRAQEYSLTRVFARMHTHTGSQLLDRAKQQYLRRLEQQNQKEV